MIQAFLRLPGISAPRIDGAGREVVGRWKCSAFKPQESFGYERESGMGANRGKDKFYGSYKDLQAVMATTDARGYWTERGPHKIFRSDDGVVVGWWCTTKTIVFQGRYVLAQKLRT